MIRAIHIPVLLMLLCIVGGFFLPIMFLPALVFAGDVVGRFRDYQYLCTSEKDSWALLAFYGRSRCGREVFIARYPSAREIYHEVGYRWYHILPDRALSRNSPFLNPRFWRNLILGQRR